MSRADEIFHRVISEGVAAVDALIADYQSENLWLDFKRATNDGIASKLDVSDRENLARAISGFGNSNGGVILWGVDCRKDPKTGADLPGAKYPIEQPHRFVSWVEGAISGCTTPGHQTVENAAVLSAGATSGFVVTLIPESVDAPLQCIQPSSRPQYYMRVGSNFGAVPHAVLAGLFGRRPQPRVAQKWYGSLVRKVPPTGLSAVSFLSLTSSGRAIARDVYVNIFVYPPGPNSAIKLLDVDGSKWERNDNAANVWNVIAKDSLRIAPGAMVQVGAFSIDVSPPFTQPLTLEMSYGCEGGERRQWRIDVSPEDIAQTCAALHADKLSGTDVLMKLFGGVE